LAVVAQIATMFVMKSKHRKTLIHYTIYNQDPLKGSLIVAILNRNEPVFYAIPAIFIGMNIRALLFWQHNTSKPYCE
jgi:hypothetical protein